MELQVKSEQQIGNFQVRTVIYGDFVIEMIKSPNAPPSADFLPAKVYMGPTILWSFKKHHCGFTGRANLVEVNGEFVIALCNRDHRHLNLVIPVKDLFYLQQTDAGDFIGGRKLQELIKLKQDTAKLLRLEPSWNAHEEKMRTKLAESARTKLAEEQQRERDESTRKRELVEQERLRRRALINSRRRLYVYTLSGSPRNGIPVVGDEWKMLTLDTFCVSVEKYDVDSGIAENPIESFVVTRKKGGPDRAAVVQVVLENPNGRKQVQPLQVKLDIVIIGGEPEEVILAEDMNHVRKLNEGTLNNSTLVMCPKTGDNNLYSVFRLKDGVIESLTELKKMSAR